MKHRHPDPIHLPGETPSRWRRWLLRALIGIALGCGAKLLWLWFGRLFDA